LDYAERQDVVLALEPEPGMLIDTVARYGDLLDELMARRVETARLRLTIDIGHLHCQGELPIADQIERHGDRLANVHIEDMRVGIHEHLMFGEGEIDFPPLIAALAKIGYAGLVVVELSRHSHEGPTAARRAYNYLMPLIQELDGAGSREHGAGSGNF
jgi:sugar phosphate isomerase/epimerase